MSEPKGLSTTSPRTSHERKSGLDLVGVVVVVVCCLYTVLAFPHRTADKRTNKGGRDASGMEGIKSSGNGFCHNGGIFFLQHLYD